MSCSKVRVHAAFGQPCVIDALPVAAPSRWLAGMTPAVCQHSSGLVSASFTQQQHQLLPQLTAVTASDGPLLQHIVLSSCLLPCHVLFAGTARASSCSSMA